MSDLCVSAGIENPFGGMLSAANKHDNPREAVPDCGSVVGGLSIASVVPSFLVWHLRIKFIDRCKSLVKSKSRAIARKPGDCSHALRKGARAQ